jgi:hypothetical protein
MATQEGRPMTLEEEITALKNRIAKLDRDYDTAVAEGNDQKQISLQISLLATITECRASLRDYEQERRLGQERPNTLEITALKKEIAHCWTLHAAAVAEGNDQMQISLLATITECRASLLDYEQERRLGQEIHQPQPQAQSAPTAQFPVQSKSLICLKLNYFLLCLSLTLSVILFFQHTFNSNLNKVLFSVPLSLYLSLTSSLCLFSHKLSVFHGYFFNLLVVSYSAAPAVHAPHIPLSTTHTESSEHSPRLQNIPSTSGKYLANFLEFSFYYLQVLVCVKLN